MADRDAGIKNSGQASWLSPQWGWGGTWSSWVSLISSLPHLALVAGLFKSRFSKFIFLFMSCWLAWMFVYHVSVWGSWRSEEGDESPGTGVVDGLWVALWVLRIKPRSDARATNTLSCGVMESHLQLQFHSVIMEKFLWVRQKAKDRSRGLGLDSRVLKHWLMFSCYYRWFLKISILMLPSVYGSLRTTEIILPLPLEYRHNIIFLICCSAGCWPQSFHMLSK